MSLNRNEFSRKSQIEEFFSNKTILYFFILILIVKLVSIVIPPLVTTDLVRSLFYGKHFWDIGFDVYKLTPIQIDPNFNIIDQTTHLKAWPYNTYDYGLISLLYYALLGILPINLSMQIIIAKLILNFVDIIVFLFLILLFPKNKEIPLIFWLAMIPFSSIEGQPLSFTLLFFVSSLYFYKENKKGFAYFIVALGFHWKYVTLLLLPYYLINDVIIYRSNQKTQLSNAKSFLQPIGIFLVTFLTLMFPILFSPYILSYISFGGNLPVQSLPWNPFYLAYPFTLSGYLLGIFVIYILYSWFELKKEGKLTEGLGFLPLLGLFGFLLIYKYAFPWYWMWGIPFFSIVPIKTRKFFFIYITICLIAAIEFINWTVGFPFIMNLF